MNFKCLVIGALGSIGRRYVKILENLGCEVFSADINDGYAISMASFNAHSIMRVIVASPTDTHLKYMEILEDTNAHVLIEKPVLMTKEQYVCLSDRVKSKTRMVSNWLWLPSVFPIPGMNVIYYNYFDQGKEKYEFNMAQPIYLGKKQSVFKNDSTVFRCSINSYQVFTEDVQRSYISMIEEWIKEPEENRLWTLEDSYKMTEKIWRFEHERKELAAAGK